MKYRKLGKTGLKVSVIGVGTWQFGGEWGKNFTQLEVDQILDRARDLGINLIDTAECYGDHLSEILIGNAIKKNRKDWIIATKFGHSFDGHLQRGSHWTPQEVLKQLEDSLKALQTDAIDLYQFHSGDVEEIKNNEVTKGVDMAQWALAWCLRNPAVSTVIPGCKSISQIESNAKAANF